MIRKFFSRLFSTGECRCKVTHLNCDFRVTDVLEPDEDYDQVRFKTCKRCGSSWLSILFEAPHYSRTIHWYVALLPDRFDQTAFRGTRENVDATFFNSRLCFYQDVRPGSDPEKYTGTPRRRV